MKEKLRLAFPLLLLVPALGACGAPLRELECPEANVFVGECDTGVAGAAAGSGVCLHTEVNRCASTVRDSRGLVDCIARLRDLVTPTQLDRLMSCAAEAPAAPRYRDEVDGGDNPWEGGCHYAYSDLACTRDKNLYIADYCQSATELLEWTDAACHPKQPLDEKLYDCNALCIAKGHRGGACTYGQDPPCPPGVTTARCFCY